MNNTTIIIECVGLPGSGKTTYCGYFSELLKQKKFSVIMWNDLKTYVHELNFFKKIYLLVKTLFFSGYSLFLYSIILACHKIYSIDSIYRYLRLLIFNTALTEYLKKRKVDIVLLDQWIIQEMWSATIFRLKSYKIWKYLKNFYFKIDFVFYFDIDILTASKRISLRNTNFSRFDNMDSQKRPNELSKYNSYLYQLYETSDCKNKFILSSKQSPFNNAEIFFQHLDLSF